MRSVTSLLRLYTSVNLPICDENSGDDIELQSEIMTKLLSLAYATAIDRSKWQEFCDALSGFNSAPIMMFGHNISSDESLGIIGGGLDPVELDRYHGHFASQNPWMHMNLAMPVGKVGVSDQALPRSELFRTEFYNDWLRLQEDIVAGPAMMCYRSSDRIIAMAGPCRARGVDNSLPQTVALFEFLAPHLAHSIKLSAALSNGVSSSFSHLNASPYGIIILRRSGRVGFVNASAEHFMSDTGYMKTGYNEKLLSKDESLQTCFNDAIDAMQKHKFSELPAPLTVDIDPYGSCVFHWHIISDEVDHKFPDTAWADPVVGAMVLTGQFGIEPNDDRGQIARSFGATPAEAKLAQGILNGLSLYEYADLNKLSRHTVRNQMRMLLVKTNTANQVEFVRKMMLLTSPFTSI